MIGESETKEILNKFKDKDGLLIKHKGTETVKGDWDRKKRVMDYLINMGFLDSVLHMDHRYYILTKKGLKLIEKEETVKEDDKVVNKGKTELTLGREKAVLVYLQEKGRALKREVANAIDETEDTTYQVLRDMLTEKTVLMEKQNGKNVYYLPDSIHQTKEPTPKEVKPKAEYKAITEKHEEIMIQPGSVKVDVINGSDPYPANNLFNECDILGFLKGSAEEIIIKPKVSIIASFQGKKEILKGHDSLPVEVQEATEMTMIPGDETYQLDIKVEV